MIGLPGNGPRKGGKLMNKHQRDIFWAEVSGCEHVVQIYDTDEIFMDTLVAFVGGALAGAHSAVVVATSAHRQQLDKRLAAMGLDVAAAKSGDQFVSLDAEVTMAKFMVNGWPDAELFSTTITEALKRARRKGGKVRVFGEMVAVMWAQRHCGAAIKLEHLWNELCQKESFPLFCAYPKIGFTENPSGSIARVCALHSRILPSG
jgi:MEDS: MEthanogen/methylotroph, DcmR Sensory domain